MRFFLLAGLVGVVLGATNDNNTTCGDTDGTTSGATDPFTCPTDGWIFGSGTLASGDCAAKPCTEAECCHACGTTDTVTDCIGDVCATAAATNVWTELDKCATTCGVGYTGGDHDTKCVECSTFGASCQNSCAAAGTKKYRRTDDTCSATCDTNYKPHASTPATEKCVIKTCTQASGATAALTIDCAANNGGVAGGDATACACDCSGVDWWTADGTTKLCTVGATHTHTDAKAVATTTAFTAAGAKTVTCAGTAKANLVSDNSTAGEATYKVDRVGGAWKWAPTSTGTFTTNAIKCQEPAAVPQCTAHATASTSQPWNKIVCDAGHGTAAGAISTGAASTCTCTCASGWGGADCSKANCVATTGTTAATTKTVVCDATNGTVAGVDGACTCTCKNSYTGADCKTAPAAGTVNLKGTCKDKDGKAVAAQKDKGEKACKDATAGNVWTATVDTTLLGTCKDKDGKEVTAQKDKGKKACEDATTGNKWTAKKKDDDESPAFIAGAAIGLISLLL